MSPRYQFEGFELNLKRYELRRNGHALKLEKIPMELLILLVSKQGELVSREEIIEKLWGQDVFVETEHGINTAIRKIRQTLGDDPAQSRFVQTVVGKGYRFVPRVLTKPDDFDDSAAERVAAVQVAADRLKRRVWILASAGVLLIAILIFSWNLLGVRKRLLFPDGSAHIRSLAVLPLTNLSGDPEQEYFADGMTEELITELSRVSSLRVISRTSVMHYKLEKKKLLPEIARELNSDAIVEGSVLRSGNRVRIAVHMIDASIDRQLLSETYEGELGDILKLQREVAVTITQQVRLKLTPEQQILLHQDRKVNPEAYELYLKGRYSWNRRTATDLVAAISYFNQAIAKDPGYALAYSGLADALGILPAYGGRPSEAYPRSNAAARKALELDPTLAHVHAVLGSNEMDYDWDFSGGEAEFKKALELDTSDATSHQWYAMNLAMIGGREREALAEVNRAHELEPLSPIISFQVGNVHLLGRRFDEAIAVCKKLETENPTFAAARLCLALAYWGKRMYPQVIEEWKVYAQLSGDPSESAFASALEHGFRSAGWKGALSKGIETRQAQRKNGYYSALMIALLCADLGDKDQTFMWLNIAYQERDQRLLSLRTYFQFDSLSSDPRFAELVLKVGLPVAPTSR